MEQKREPCVNRPEAVHFAHNLWIRVGQVRQILPTLLEAVDIPALYRADERPPPSDRPWILANMVTSVDGATAVDGLSGKLGGDGDKAVFRAVRALADAIVVGAGTAVAENYGPPVLSPDLIATRVASGQTPLPRIVVVSNTLRSFSNFGTRLFTTDGFRPTVITSGAAPPEQVEAMRSVADVEVIGSAEVDLSAMFAKLRADGIMRALVEGGPTLNGHLLAADLLDEVVLTFAPALASGRSNRFAINESATLHQLRLVRVLEADSHLFFRYVRDR